MEGLGSTLFHLSGRELFLLMFLPAVFVIFIVILVLLAQGVTRARRDGS